MCRACASVHLCHTQLYQAASLCQLPGHGCQVLRGLCEAALPGSCAFPKLSAAHPVSQWQCSADCIGKLLLRQAACLWANASLGFGCKLGVPATPPGPAASQITERITRQPNAWLWPEVDVNAWLWPLSL